MTEFSSAPDDARSTVPATKGMTVGAAASPSHAQSVARAQLRVEGEAGAWRRSTWRNDC